MKQNIFIGQFPWNVALMNETISYGQEIKTYLCGGVLIHPKVRIGIT